MWLDKVVGLSHVIASVLVPSFFRFAFVFYPSFFHLVFVFYPSFFHFAFVSYPSFFRFAFVSYFISDDITMLAVPTATLTKFPGGNTARG